MTGNFSYCDHCGGNHDNDDCRDRQPPLAWTDDRIAQYDKLTDLLRECESLNSGNNICARITKIEGIVAELRKTDWETPRKSFTSFLLDQIAADVNRFPK